MYTLTRIHQTAMSIRNTTDTRSYSTVVGNKQDQQDYLLVYNEQLELGNTPPIDRLFFNAVDGLEACAEKNGWGPEEFKKLISGLQPMGKHCFTVQCKGREETKSFFEKTHTVQVFGTRVFVGATAESCGMKIDPDLIRIRIDDLPAAIPDKYVHEKLGKYGIVGPKAEKDRIREGKWKGFENGTRFYYMKHIEDTEMGLPPVFYVKNQRVRVSHQGQLRGRERERERNVVGEENLKMMR